MMKSFLTLLTIMLTASLAFAQPKAAEKYYKKGMSHMESQQYDEAKEEFKAAIWEYDKSDAKKDAKYQELHKLMAQIYILQEKPIASVKHYKRDLAVNANQEDVWISLSQAYWNSEQQDKARETLEQAIEVDGSFELAKKELYYLDHPEERPAAPKSEEEIWAEVQLAYESKDFDQAHDLLATIENWDSKPEYLRLSTDMYEQQGKNKEALAGNQKLLTASPEDAGLMRKVADLALETGNDNLALSTYDELLKIEKDDDKLLVSHARLAMKMNNPGEAVKSLKRAVKIDEENGEYYYLLARAFEAEGNTSQYNSSMEKAAAIGYPDAMALVVKKDPEVDPKESIEEQPEEPVIVEKVPETKPEVEVSMKTPPVEPEKEVTVPMEEKVTPKQEDIVLETKPQTVPENPVSNPVNPAEITTEKEVGKEIMEEPAIEIAENLPEAEASTNEKEVLPEEKPVVNTPPVKEEKPAPQPVVEVETPQEPVVVEEKPEEITLEKTNTKETETLAEPDPKKPEVQPEVKVVEVEEPEVMPEPVEPADTEEATAEVDNPNTESADTENTSPSWTPTTKTTTTTTTTDDQEAEEEEDDTAEPEKPAYSPTPRIPGILNPMAVDHVIQQRKKKKKKNN